MSLIAARAWVRSKNLPISQPVRVHGFKGNLTGGFADTADEISALAKRQTEIVKMTEDVEATFDPTRGIGRKGAKVSFTGSILHEFAETTPEQLEKFHKELLAQTAAKEGKEVENRLDKHAKVGTNGK